MKVLFLGTSNLLHPWYDDVLEVAADRWLIPLFDRSRPVAPQFEGLDVVIDQGGNHDERRGDFKCPLAEFRLQQVQIRGEIAIRPKFDPLVAGFDYLVQEAIPRSLFRITREPHSPGVWCTADFDIHSDFSLSEDQ